ncbi:hypothetical protein EDC04DRAFT_2599587 [Pisolithus marmoratus]|nr:hypothetical protein EDC04DRAFT_2599587 [Pisolithus marmoratus]
MYLGHWLMSFKKVDYYTLANQVDYTFVTNVDYDSFAIQLHYTLVCNASTFSVGCGILLEAILMAWKCATGLWYSATGHRYNRLWVQYHGSQMFPAFLPITQGKPLLIHRLRVMSENAFNKALEMKEADQESTWLCALTTAWELEAVSHWREFLLAIQEENMQHFIQSADDLQLFMNILEHCSVNELKDEENFQVGMYG